MLTEKGLAGSPPRAQNENQETYVFPASFSQQRLWFLHQLNPASPAYSMLAQFRIEGPLNPSMLERTLNEIVRRHEALRTRFSAEDGEVLQVISSSDTLAVPKIDLSHDTIEDSEAAARQWLQAEAGRPFDLEHGPLIRAAVLRLGPDAHVLSVNMHHIISDGWSLGVLMREASELYGAYLAGRQPALLELEIQYADYSLWQREWLQGEVLEAQVAYWRQELAGAPTALDLPVDHPRTMQQSHRGGQHPVRLAAALAQPLRQLGRQHGATLYMVLLAGFQVLLARYTGQQQVLVGSPIAGRTRRETEGLIGFFVNTLVLRGNLAGDPSFAEMLERVKDTTLNAFAHQDVPFEKLVEVLSPQRDLSRSPLFQVMFILQNAPMGRLELGPARLVPLAADNGTAKFEITLSLEEQADGGIEGYWEYNGDLFEPATIERMADHYIRLLEAALADPRRPVALLDFLAPQERRQLLIDWNDTRAPYPDACLHELFELQAARTPDAVAVSSPDGSLTYRELNGRANRLARLLRKRGAGAEKRVAIMMETSAEMIAALLAILKSGAAYVPIDPGFPKDRIAYTLAQSGAIFALTDRNPWEPDSFSCACFPFSAAEEAAWDQTFENLPSCATTANAAYVIYTSGSTGRPKGVVVEHRQVNRYCQAIRQRLGLTPNANYAMLQPLVVDSCETVLMPWMCHGGVLHLLSRRSALDPEAVTRYFRRHRVDVLKIAPSHLAELLDASSAPENLLPRQALVLGGEASRWDWIHRDVMPRVRPEVCVHIHYGPTETTVGVLTYPVDQQEARRGPFAPLGTPLNNVTAHIVSSSMLLAPVGIAGEILIGGETVARGYLDRPDLTAERFVPDPFSNMPGARSYRTGDVGRRLPDGTIEFLGRADYQTKIRGLRIEPGEIESMLLEHPRVERGLVLGQDDGSGGKMLIAYVVSRSAPDTSLGTELRAWLFERLPDYMVPAAIVRLDSIPLTAQGKVDLAALPRSTAVQAIRSIATTEAPRTALEADVVMLWQELLGTRPIGINDNFFERGGHSLLVIRMLALVRRRLGHKVPPAAFIRRPTVAHLASLISEASDVAAPGIVVHLQPAGQAIPFICVHPMGGDVLCYAQLAMALAPDRPLLAIQAPLTSGPETIEGIAALYIAEMLRVVPYGRCFLGGWSFGGLIAFEMARQLRERSSPVEGLVLLDTHPPRTDPRAGRGAEPDLLERFAANVGHMLGQNPAEQAASFRSLETERQRALLRQALHHAGVLESGSERELDGVLARFTRHAEAAEKYGPYRVAQDIELFAVSDARSLANRWLRWTTADIRAHAVDGDHYSMLRKPYVDALAGQLEHCLNAVGQARAREVGSW